jgi:hypothetical protein
VKKTLSKVAYVSMLAALSGIGLGVIIPAKSAPRGTAARHSQTSKPLTTVKATLMRVTSLSQRRPTLMPRWRVCSGPRRAPSKST